jgi:hypothetical protein
MFNKIKNGLTTTTLIFSSIPFDRSLIEKGCIVYIYWVTFNVLIKAFFSISPGSPAATLKDIYIFFLLLLAMGFISLHKFNIKKITLIDKIMFLFLVYAIYQVFRTYMLIDNLFIPLFRFRLYFISTLLYFILRFSLQLKNFILIYKWIIILFFISFLYGTIEGISLTFIPEIRGPYIDFLRRSVTIMPDWVGREWLFFYRSPGVAGEMVYSGVFYLIGAALILPYIGKGFKEIPYTKISLKLFLVLSLSAVFLSTSKTAWALFIIGLFFLGVFNKKYRLPFILFGIMLLIFIKYIYFLSEDFSRSVNMYFYDITVQYLSRLNEVLTDSPFLGFGYEVYSTEINLHDINVGLSDYSKSMGLGSEFFFGSWFWQFGLLGSLLYIVVYFIIPIFYFARNKSTLIERGLAFAILIAGLSSVHYAAIINSGANVIVWFSLAFLAELNDPCNYKTQNLI